MEAFTENNTVRLCGTVSGIPVYSHSSRGQDFFSFPLSVLRLSGNADTLNIIARPEQLEGLRMQEGDRLCVSGQLRSYNNRRGAGAKLVITVFTSELCSWEGEDSNLVRLTGTLCKAPSLRSTPLGRDICDLMLAVNRHYGRSDYLPCICWGITARRAALWPVGTRVRLEGRVQSRSYRKLTEQGPEFRTAFEVSVTEIEACPEEEAFPVIP